MDPKPTRSATPSYRLLDHLTRTKAAPPPQSTENNSPAVPAVNYSNPLHSIPVNNAPTQQPTPQPQPQAHTQTPSHPQPQPQPQSQSRPQSQPQSQSQPNPNSHNHHRHYSRSRSHSHSPNYSQHSRSSPRAQSRRQSSLLLPLPEARIRRNLPRSKQRRGHRPLATERWVPPRPVRLPYRLHLNSRHSICVRPIILLRAPPLSPRIPLPLSMAPRVP
ncbi:hypothetical protein EDB83DRAFT_208024 [Lactarius deliciosus]|nr:hypothetical protein EDB83DRAFT_208024 [Lactarius deliciosus]